MIHEWSLHLLLAPCAVALLAALLLYHVRSWYRLRHIPGPFLASISNLWMVKNVLSGRLHEVLKDVSDRYGPLVRIGPNEVLTTDPEVIRMMNSVRSPYTKGDFYQLGRIVPDEDTIVSLRDDGQHKLLRSKMVAAFGGKENEGFGFGAGIDRQIMQFVNLIDTKYISTATCYCPLQFFRKTSFFTLDVMGDISFGGAFGFLAEDRDLYRYNEIHDESLPVMNIISALPWMSNLVYRWPFRLMLPTEGDEVGFGRLMGFAKAFVDKRLEPGARPEKDMTQAFINSGMTRSELIQQVFVQIIAGSVTSATAICMTLLCLISTPSAYNGLQKEIDQAIQKGWISSPISEPEAKQLPYLQAVIREGLRMYPPVTGMGSKQVPPGGDMINGHFLPEGTQVGTNTFGLMRSKDIWGKDADVFRPERWLEASEAELKVMNTVVDMIFGHGKYACLGKPIAMMELNKVYVELLRRFDFTIVNPQIPMKAWSAVFWVANDFWLRITRRRLEA
ncbi:cytochrome P450 [Pseudomassariella vexata]|uniref:Cytochrome P450 n=1 Tax=Pseudomassariella vexata TaxID=1141098 RepID=A0A1Y2EHQ0_9PEZI|nr:cytochrome P450 [Pseudomassariella vexata]ORY70305.1 cytochrome P450 [Pseudomassariella vexata]